MPVTVSSQKQLDGASGEDTVTRETQATMVNYEIRLIWNKTESYCPMSIFITQTNSCLSNLTAIFEKSGDSR